MVNSANIYKEATWCWTEGDVAAAFREIAVGFRTYLLRMHQVQSSPHVSRLWEAVTIRETTRNETNLTTGCLV